MSLSQCQAPRVVSIFTQFLAHSTDHNIFNDLSEDSFGMCTFQTEFEGNLM